MNSSPLPPLPTIQSNRWKLKGHSPLLVRGEGDGRIGGGFLSPLQPPYPSPPPRVTSCCVPCYKTQPSVSMVNTRLGPGACSSRLSSKTGCRKQRPTANCSARHQPTSPYSLTHPPTHSTLLHSPSQCPLLSWDLFARKFLSIWSVSSFARLLSSCPAGLLSKHKKG